VDDRPWHRFYRPGARPTLSYPSLTLPALIAERAARDPEVPALVFRERVLTYGELTRRIRQAANAFAAAGLRPGERALLMLPNSPAYVTAYYGVLAAGGVAVPVNPLYVAREVAHIASDAAARLVVVDRALQGSVAALGSERVIAVDVDGPEPWADAPDAEPAATVAADDLAVLQYTGGTTGWPKGAMLTHRNLVANVLQLAELGEAPPPGEERILTILPLSHVFGMTCCMNLGLHLGATLVLLPRFEIDAVMQAIRRHRITSFPGVPTMYVAVLNYPDAESYGIANIRSISSGGAAMPAQVAATFEQRFGARMSEGYGLSEASPVTHTNPTWDPGLRRPGSIGIPLPDTDARIVDLETGSRVLPPGEAGELCVRGPQVMRGYWRREEATAQALRDGWLYTGDVARMDADGYFYILDRKKDMIIVSGYNVYPREVEEVLYQHPAVAEAAAVGVPDPYRGEAVKACIVPRPGTSPTAEEIVAFCRERLAPFKVPRQVEFRASLPKSGAGKILRRELAGG
jgi:long-chain acyl-CoA synthetase